MCAALGHGEAIDPRLPTLSGERSIGSHWQSAKRCSKLGFFPFAHAGRERIEIGVSRPRECRFQPADGPRCRPFAGVE